MDFVEISVRTLVGFIMRSGDIDNRYHGSTEDAMQRGGRIHRKIQKMQGPSYRSEVSLSYTYSASKYQILIEGRADGILEEEGKVPMIDEIKGTFKKLETMKEPEGVHLAQAKVYAAIYLLTNKLPEIRVRMTYCNMDTEDIRYFEYEYKAVDLTAWFKDLIGKYRLFADHSARWAELRNESIRNCKFPYPYRAGQKELAAGVYRTIARGKKLFLEAPTGTGKTLTVMYPAIQAVGQGKAEKIFYLTAKSVTGAAAADTARLLRAEQGLRMKTVMLTAKDKICLKKGAACNPDECPYAKGHFDRVNDAMYDMMTHEDNYSREALLYYSEKHKVCPFEFSLDMSLFADFIICDYNYVFDPFVYLKRYFAENVKGSYIFLVDEAHNLSDRGRDIYSADLIRDHYLLISSELSDLKVSFKSQLTTIVNTLNSLYDAYTKPGFIDSIEDIIQKLDRLAGAISAYLDEDKEAGPMRDRILDLYFEVRRFLTIYDLMDEKYRIYEEEDDALGYRIRLYCVDPSTNLAACMDRGVSSILFSATFLPIQYYKQISGGSPDDYEMYANSVFDPSARGLMIASDATSRYAQRGPEQYGLVADYIHKISTAKKGNYMVFFPSHAYLEEVYESYMDRYADDGFKILAQGYGMNEEEREAFLGYFSEGNNVDLSDIIDMDVEYVEDEPVIGFCVMGGIFSEGVDLRGDSLIGALIVGCGIPLVCNEREVLRNYFDEAGFDGYDYAYRFPGMNKVLQAAGRVIRTEHDRGVVALLDMRFLQPSYRNLFPREWKKIKRVSTDSVNEYLENFWSVNTRLSEDGSSSPE
ncbi:ATP-dependent DNA helicase [Butyrivibrio sp. MC2013]|uniref:ATP-dependent DNA helicase n=1 Tax=Butyrivibrio sp. MC2013 TaxID=1280686 RepID=UPI00041FF356|nr:ATP-dependent DNA helicase [Butyrivibrio sp. MC2013]